MKLRLPITFMIAIVFSQVLIAQDITSYAANDAFPFGRVNPVAPEQLKDFDPLIGICDCQSLLRNGDGTWQDTTQMIWKWKYILNGLAVQDETFREGIYATSLRQVQPDSGKWVVTYSASGFIPYTVPVWIGEKEGDDIVLYKDQQAPNGMDGDYRITFYEISRNGFEWKGEWISKDRSIVYPTWYISCKKRI